MVSTISFDYKSVVNVDIGPSILGPEFESEDSVFAVLLVCYEIGDP